MKKILTALAICTVGAALADVFSDNMVGYNTASVGAQQIIGCNFEAVGGGATTFQTLNGGKTFSNGDMIWVWDGSSYGQGYTWDAGEGTWYDNAADDVIDPPVDAGVGFWLICSAAESVRMAGQVPPSGTQLVIPAGQSLISTPVPIDLDLSGANVAWSGVSNGDYIWVWDGSSYGQGFTWDAGESVWYDNAADDVAGMVAAGGVGFWLINSAQVTMTMTY